METNRKSCRNDNVWIQKLDQALSKSSVDDEILLCAAFEHLKVFADFLTKDEKEFMPQEEINNVLLSKLFYDKMHDLIPKKRFTCQVDGNSGWPIPLLPLELFGKAKFSEDFRRNLFFECLKVGDILDCRVMSILATQCSLKVIHKYGAFRILEDLNITVILQADLDEIALLPYKLHKDDLLRVAVKNIVTEPQIVVDVTVNDSILASKKHTEKLGIISKEDLPSYVRDPPDVSQFKSFSDYLNSLPGFQNHLLYQDMTPKFGIDSNRIYSFFPKFECFLCPDDFTGEALLKAAKKNDLTDLFDDLERTVLTKSAIIKRAVVNCEKAYSLDPNNNYAKEYLADGLYRAAHGYYQKKRYQDALKCAEKVLSLNPNHSAAPLMIDYLKLKHSEVLLDLDAVSLHELQAEKNKLVTQLKQIETHGDVKSVKIKVEKP